MDSKTFKEKLTSKSRYLRSFLSSGYPLGDVTAIDFVPNLMDDLTDRDAAIEDRIKALEARPSAYVTHGFVPSGAATSVSYTDSGPKPPSREELLSKQAEVMSGYSFAGPKPKPTPSQGFNLSKARIDALAAYYADQLDKAWVASAAKAKIDKAAAELRARELKVAADHAWLEAHIKTIGIEPKPKVTYRVFGALKAGPFDTLIRAENEVELHTSWLVNSWPPTYIAASDGSLLQEHKYNGLGQGRWVDV